jgi:hypothetical protein
VSQICINLQRALQDTIEKSGTSTIARGPLSAPTFLVVFGVGLGYHLRELVRATKVRWVIIIEPFTEFLRHSFEVVDWHELLDDVEADGGCVQVITELDPGRVVSLIMQEVARRGTPYLDGTWVFTHYPIWAFAEAAKRMHGAASFAYINRGFYEDELVMMTNAVTNFSARSFWLLDSKPRLHRPETAVIVGAGPSLDEGIETLHRIRDKVIVFSAGTSLRPLLRQGIAPDFHCELENGPQVVEVLEEARRHGDLAQVRLIASSTVDPRVPGMFGETILFHTHLSRRASADRRRGADLRQHRHVGCRTSRVYRLPAFRYRLRCSARRERSCRRDHLSRYRQMADHGETTRTLSARA